MSTINGTAGNDVLAGTSGNDVFNGSTGFDTAQVTASSGDAVFSLDPQGRWVVTSPQGLDTLDSMEAVQFADGRVTLGLEQFRVNAAAAFDQTQPVLTSLPDGGFLATWLTGTSVRAQRFDQGGVPIGSEMVAPALGPQPPVAQHHDAAALADGGYVIVAVVGDKASAEAQIVPVIAVMRFSSAGAFVGGWGVAQGTRSLYYGSDVSDPAITALDDGNFLVSWSTTTYSRWGSSSGFAVQRLDSSGAPSGQSVALGARGDVGALAGGGYALASVSGAGDLGVRLFDATGALVGAQMQLATGVSGQPKITALADGTHLLVWKVRAGDGFGIDAQRFDAAWTALGTPVRVNTDALFDPAAPAVTALPGGGWVVAWTSQAQGGGDTDIHARRFDASGLPAGGEMVVNMTTAGAQQQPTLTALEDGGFALAWMSAGQGGDGWDIHAQRFDASGAPMLSLHALEGDASANTLAFAGSERVHLVGGGGDDLLQGGSGDDAIDGGADSDTAAIADLHEAITWQVNVDRVLRITAPQTGSDVLQSVERVRAEGASIGTEFEGNTQVRVADSGSPFMSLQEPRAAVLSDGSMVVVWQRYGTDAGLYAQRLEASGTPAGPATLIDGAHASVAALGDGGYVLAWSTGADVDLQRFDATGAALGGAVRVNDAVAGYEAAPVVQALDNGGYVVAWSRNVYPDGYGIFSRQFDASGSPTNPETRVNTTPGPYPGEQSIAVLGDGSYVITWTMGDPPTWPGEPGYDIYAQRFDADGVPAGGEVRVNATTTGHQLRSEVAALADGGYVVTWMNYSDRDIKAQRFDASGQPAGGEILVNPVARHSDDKGPAVTALADGGYAIAWAAADGDGSGVTVQRYDAAGAPVGSATRVNTVLAGDQTQPALTALPAGGYMVAWVSRHGQAFGIETQRFDANNLREGHLTLTGGAEDNVLRVTTASEGVELIGGGGKDILAAAAAWDVLTGGSGGDTFEFAAAGNGVDIITDWGMGDRISVAGASFGGAVTAGTGEAVALNAVQASTVAGTTTLFIGTDATPGADVVIRLAGSFAADSFTLNGTLIEAPKGVVVTGRGDLVGGEGDDTLIPLHGVTRMEGGDGDDTYVLGNPNDRLIEQPGGGSDEVRSEWSYRLGDNLERLVLAGDRHTRGTGNDLDNVVTGNGGRNVLTGGAGADTLTGGGGADQFVYRSVEESGIAPGTWDIVTDFSSLEGDRVDLRDIDANPARPGKQRFVFIGSAEFSSGDATGQLRFDAGTHMLYASIDADAQAEMAIELAGVTALAAGGLTL